MNSKIKVLGKVVGTISSVLVIGYLGISAISVKANNLGNQPQINYPQYSYSWADFARGMENIRW